MVVKCECTITFRNSCCYQTHCNGLLTLTVAETETENDKKWVVWDCVKVYTLHRDWDSGRDSDRCHWVLYPISRPRSAPIFLNKQVAMTSGLGHCLGHCTSVYFLHIIGIGLVLGLGLGHWQCEQVVSGTGYSSFKNWKSFPYDTVKHVVSGFFVKQKERH